MSHGAGQPSCTTVSLGKYVRRALRAAAGKPPKRKKPKDPAAAAERMIVASGGVSLERTSSFSTDSTTAAARKESVVRVVLKSGVVEVYSGVVLACTVIRKHPPGLCLAHPDVFRNPHGAVVRPLEPLFPGQKFLLLPESTVVRLKQKIPESAVGAFPDDDDDASEEDDQLDYSSGAAASSSEEEDLDLDQDAAAAEFDHDEEDDDRGGALMAGCSAREFYVENDRWAQCRFEKLVRRGLAVEQSKDDHPNAKGQQQKTKKKRKGKKTSNKRRKDRRVRFAAAPAGAGFRRLATLRRMWEPTLPSVEEEEGGEAYSTTPELVSSK